MPGLLAYAAALLVCGVGILAGADGRAENTGIPIAWWIVPAWIAASLVAGYAVNRPLVLVVPWAVVVAVIAAVSAGFPYAEVDGHVAVDVIYYAGTYAIGQTLLAALALGVRRGMDARRSNHVAT